MDSSRVLCRHRIAQALGDFVNGLPPETVDLEQIREAALETWWTQPESHHLESAQRLETKEVRGYSTKQDLRARGIADRDESAETTRHRKYWVR